MKDTINIYETDSIVLSKTVDNSIFTIIVDKPQKDAYFDGVSNEVFFSISATLTIFIVGIIISRIIAYSGRRQKRKQIKKYFRLFINNIYEKLLPQLTEGYEKYCKIITIDGGMPQTPPKQLVGDYERVTKSDIPELLTAFNYNKNVSRVISGMDYITRVIDESEKFHNKVLPESNRLRNEISSLLEQYLDKLYEYTEFERNNIQKFDSDKSWILINSSLIKYYKEYSGKRVLSKIISEIVRPIQMDLVNNNYFRVKPLASQVTEIGKNISLRYDELSRITLEVQQQYQEFYEGIKRINDMEDIEL